MNALLIYLKQNNKAYEILLNTNAKSTPSAIVAIELKHISGTSLEGRCCSIPRKANAAIRSTAINATNISATKIAHSLLRSLSYHLRESYCGARKARSPNAE